MKPEAADPLFDARALFASLGVLLAALVLTWRTGSFEFLNYDDDVYVTSNPFVAGGFDGERELEPGLTATNAGRAFTSFHAANWHPLTWLSHQLDVTLFGLDAGAHHRTNAVLHAGNAALLCLALVALTRALGPSLFVALLFALHPQRAESVAWIAERKDLLAGTFWMTTLLAYAWHRRRPSRGRYVLVALSLALGLLAKPMLVTLPCVLVLVDRWPLGRTEPLGRLLVEKAPLFLLSLVSSLVTMRAQEAGGALDALIGLPFSERLGNAFAALWLYLADFLWPTRLALFYPHPASFADAVWNAWGREALLGMALALGLAALGVALRRRVPALLVGWLWFLGTLVPVIGLVQVGAQSHADRYTYVPTIGLGIALAWSARALLDAGPRLAPVLSGLGALWLVALVPLSWRQVSTWRDTETVMRHALDVTERNFVAQTNLAGLHERAGDWTAAIEAYRTAASWGTGQTLVHYQLGRALAITGRGEEANAEFRRVLADPEPRAGTQPHYHAARVSLGISLSRQGRPAEAAPVLARAWRSDATPRAERLAAGQALAWLLATTPDDSLRDGAAAKTIALASLDHGATPELLEALAAAHAELGEWDAALRVQEDALTRIPPSGQPGALMRLARYQDRRTYRTP